MRLRPVGLTTLAIGLVLAIASMSILTLVARWWTDALYFDVLQLTTFVGVALMWTGIVMFIVKSSPNHRLLFAGLINIVAGILLATVSWIFLTKGGWEGDYFTYLGLLDTFRVALIAIPTGVAMLVVSAVRNRKSRDYCAPESENPV